MIRLPAMPEKQQAAWHALFEIHQAYPTHWTLIGGQAVYLHAIDRSATYVRPTSDADAGLDVRLRPYVLKEFTQILVRLGFHSAGTSFAGHQHRWVRGPAMVDVLIPRFMGEQAENRKGIYGGTTLAAPGLQQALRKSSVVQVQAGGKDGAVNLTSFMGILIGKGAALRILVDPKRDRHMTDALVLATTLRGADIRGVDFGPAEKSHLAYLAGHLAAQGNRRLVDSIEGGHDALARLQQLAKDWNPADPNDRF